MQPRTILAWTLLTMLILPSVAAGDSFVLPPAPVLPHGEYMEASDGTRIYTETYLPPGAGPWPAILVHTPYRYDDFRERRGFGHDVADEYVKLGYAVVVADVRGTGNSGGCFGMMDRREQEDSAELVEWVADRPWSTGKVGMKGISYPGTTPHEAAILAPPSLAAIVTAAGVTNQWRNVYRGGVPIEGRYYGLTYFASADMPPSSDVGAGAVWARHVAENGCGEEEMLVHRMPGVYERGLYDGYWAERNLTRGVANVSAPLLYSQGFGDDRVFPIEALGWFNEIQAPKRAFIHQGGHWYLTTPEYVSLERAWFEHWLKGVDNGVLSTPLVQVESNLGYRTESAWPPLATTPVRSWLAPGALVASAPATSTETYAAGVPDVRVGDLNDPQTFIIGDVSSGTIWRAVEGTVRGAGNAAADAATEAAVGAINLTYLGAPLASPLHLSGTARLHLRAASGSEHTYFLASLYDVHDGVWREVAVGWFNAHLRDGFDRSAPLEPGVFYDLEWPFDPDDHVFAVGHQVGLRILGSDERAVLGPLGENTVEYGGSWIELPTV